MKKLLFAQMFALCCFGFTLTGCSSDEPTVVEEAVMTDQDMSDYEAEMDATDPIEE